VDVVEFRFGSSSDLNLNGHLHYPANSLHCCTFTTASLSSSLRTTSHPTIIAFRQPDRNKTEKTDHFLLQNWCNLPDHRSTTVSQHTSFDVTHRDRGGIGTHIIRGSGLSLCQDRGVVYYESIKRDLKTRPIYECRCDERLITTVEESTLLTYTGLLGELEHLKIKTRLIDEMCPSVMGEYVFLK
jgi:hypothetical protein